MIYTNSMAHKPQLNFNSGFLISMKIITRISYAFFLPIIDLMHITTLFYGALAWGSIGLHVKALVTNLPVAHHRHVQNNGFELQHGCPMTSMNKVYCYAGNSK